MLLLKRIYEILAQQYPAEFPLAWLTELLDESPKRIKSQLQQRLIQAFSEKTLLLCIENLDILFSGLGADGQHEWRAFLQEHPFTTIMASTQRLFADVKLREKPFFGFFSPIPLEPLNVNDALELLRRVAKNRTANDLVAFLDSAEGRSRVRALHHLAGGNHRIYVVLSGFITRESLDDLVGPFQKMADDLTPYFQERLRWLSPQQRQIIEFLCSQDRPCMPKQIARHLLATESSISSQLKKLLEIGYVLRAERGRESLYELAEPLMRLASEVKAQHRRPLQMLVNFLRVWYRPDDLPRLMREAGTDSLRRHISAAIKASQTSPDPRILILDAAIAKARVENRVKELVDALEEKAHTTNAAGDWWALASDQLVLQKDNQRALESYDRCLQEDPGNGPVWNNRGSVFYILKRYEEALDCYNKAIDIDPTDALPWNNKGFLLTGLKRHEAAIACYDKAIELDPADARQWNNKAVSCAQLEQYMEAINCFDKAIDLDPTLAGPWFNGAESQMAMGHWSDGLSQLRLAFEKFGGGQDHDVESMIELLRHHFVAGNRTTLLEFFRLYAEFAALPRLGDGLVRSLAKIDAKMTAPTALYQWRDFWLEAGAPYPELQIPLRIFSVGIEYLVKQDRKVLLDLVVAERQILEQALGLSEAD